MLFEENSCGVEDKDSVYVFNEFFFQVCQSRELKRKKTVISCI